MLDKTSVYNCFALNRVNYKTKTQSLAIFTIENAIMLIWKRTIGVAKAKKSNSQIFLNQLYIQWLPLVISDEPKLGCSAGIDHFPIYSIWSNHHSFEHGLTSSICNVSSEHLPSPLIRSHKFWESYDGRWHVSSSNIYSWYTWKISNGFLNSRSLLNPELTTSSGTGKGNEHYYLFSEKDINIGCSHYELLAHYYTAASLFKSHFRRTYNLWIIYQDKKARSYHRIYDVRTLTSYVDHDIRLK